MEGAQGALQGGAGGKSRCPGGCQHQRQLSGGCRLKAWAILMRTRQQRLFSYAQPEEGLPMLRLWQRGSFPAGSADAISIAMREGRRVPSSCPGPGALHAE